MSPPPVDLTGSLYLGMRHPSSDLPGWAALTTGRPSALGATAAARDLADRIAGLQGTDRALLRRSTLHGFADCLGALTGRGTTLVVDRGLYPIGRWAVAAVRAPVCWVRHHDTGALVRALRRIRRPVVVADGLCGGCGERFAIRAATDALDARGLLVLDDTQAIGLLGAEPDADTPFGHGGGGSLRRAGAVGREVVLVASLAKAFGVPLAAVSGPAGPVRTVAEFGGSAVHASPPTAVEVAAACHALDRNHDCLRTELTVRIKHFRAACASAGVSVRGGMFPVQAVGVRSAQQGEDLVRDLARQGIRVALTRDCRDRVVVAVVVTATHRLDELTRVAAALAGAGHG